jgi:hypothetical protein
VKNWQRQFLMGGGAAAAQWWQVAGVTCAVAYQPKGAASLSASYANLANPGTNDAAMGVAPTWTTTDGWAFDGISQYLITGYVATQAMTCLVRLSDWAGSGEVYIAIGSYKDGGTVSWLVNKSSVGGIDELYFGPIIPNSLGTTASSGIFGMAGGKGFVDGVAGTQYTGWSGTGLGLYIGAGNRDGSPIFYARVKVKAVWIGAATLTDQQVADLTAAMAAL